MHIKIGPVDGVSSFTNKHHQGLDFARQALHLSVTGAGIRPAVDLLGTAPVR
jgi:hypothetical protein